MIGESTGTVRAYISCMSYRSTTSAAAVLMLAALVGCDGDAAEINEPPRWSDAPADTVQLFEGVEAGLPLTLVDPEGEAVSVVELVAGEGLAAEVVDGELLLRPGYGQSPTSSLSVRIADASGEEALVELAIAVQPLAWLAGSEWAVADGPEVREHTIAIVDEANGQSYIFFGSGYSPQFEQMLDDVWRFNHADNTWTQVQPTGDVPSGRGSMRLASARGATSGYLWGGYGAPGTYFNDLYRVSIVAGTLDFKLISQVDEPSGRALHGFVYDDETETFALFGGVGGLTNKTFAETWTMKVSGDTATWTQAAPATSPSARYGFFYGFDEAAGRMLVFSGAQSPAAGNPVNPARDVWALDMRGEALQWSLVLEGDAVPEGRRNGCAAWDPDARRLFVWGGTPDGATTAQGLFVMDARPGKESWAALGLNAEPKIRSSGLGFYDGEAVRMGFGNGPEPQRDLQKLGY